MADNLTRSRGEDFSIQDLVLMADQGQLRVPEFQRSFRWASSDVLALFDSILKGYPVGSVLLWRKPAPRKRVTLGALTIDAPEHTDAYWVVDGQQRITSLVNAVSPVAYERDDRFRLVYVLDTKEFARPSETRSAAVVPLPDLFDVARLLDWFQVHPEFHEHAPDIQNVTALLRDFKLPSSVVGQADESVLRDIFDRMNTAGKRLRSAEIFDAIHRATGGTSEDELSIGAIADRIAASTSFGRIEDAAIYQAILVRRHPDITRDPHGEFDQGRKLASDFPGEDRDEGYREAENALERTVAFLSDTVGVPHITLLPYRFLILVLARFFSLFPDPNPRNLELLSRWFWIAAARAGELNLSGSTTTVRGLAGNIVVGDENGSVQRLLAGVQSLSAIPLPDTRHFRTNQAASKLVLCSLWALGPVDPSTREPIEPAQLARALEGRDTPSDIAVELIARDKLEKDLRLSAGNRVLAITEGEPLLGVLFDNEVAGEDQKLFDSLMISAEQLTIARSGDYRAFLESREDDIRDHLVRFLRLRSGEGFETTPPLSFLDLDDEFDEVVSRESI